MLPSSLAATAATSPYEGACKTGAYAWPYPTDSEPEPMTMFIQRVIDKRKGSAREQVSLMSGNDSCTVENATTYHICSKAVFYAAGLLVPMVSEGTKVM